MAKTVKKIIRKKVRYTSGHIEFKMELFRVDLTAKRIIDNNMSMDQAAKVIGISKATLCRLELGRKPDIDTFAKCLSFIGDDVSKYFVTVPLKVRRYVKK